MKHFNPEYTVRKIREEMREYIKKSGLKSLVVGLSGGIDSALVAALAAPVCQELEIPLIGRFIQIESNKPDEGSRADAVGNAFCADYKSVDLTDLYLDAKQAVEEDGNANQAELSHRIRLGNVKARLRMIYLYNLAQKHGGLVFSTDNYTEFLLGFWTLHGDVGDYGPIAELWKTEVYECAKWLADRELASTDRQRALQRCVDAVPTDGLGTTHSDLDQLHAATYAEVDDLLQQYLSGKRDKQLAEHPVIQRHLRSEYKRNNPYNVPRERIC
jgi:NAD+ synthetase